MLFEFSYAESLQCRLIIDIFTHGLDLDPFSILQVDWGCRIKKGGIKFDKKMKLIGCFGKGCSWKRVLLETGAFGNGWIGKWSFGKGCSWKRVLLEKVAFGNRCFWKWLNWKMVVWKGVLLEKDELENGAFGNGCFWKMDFWKRVLLEHYEKKFTKLMSFGIN